MQDLGYQILNLYSSGCGAVQWILGQHWLVLPALPSLYSPFCLSHKALQVGRQLLEDEKIEFFRKTESYPGPVLEAEVQPLDGRQGKVKRRGHR